MKVFDIFAILNLPYFLPSTKFPVFKLTLSTERLIRIKNVKLMLLLRMLQNSQEKIQMPQAILYLRIIKLSTHAVCYDLKKRYLGDMVQTPQAVNHFASEPFLDI